MKAYPIVSGEGFTVPVVGRTGPVAPSWLAEALGQSGWALQSAELGECEVRFSDGSKAGNLPYPPIQLEGIDVVASLPVIGYARMPSDFMLFTRRKLTLQLIATQLSDRWARQWAKYLLETGQQQTLPLGSGFATDCGVVIAADDLLYRATWWIDGATAEPRAIAGSGESPAPELLTLNPKGP